MIGFRIQDIVTIRYTNRPGWQREIYAYILKIYKLIPKIAVHGSDETRAEKRAIRSDEVARVNRRQARTQQ